MEKPSDRFAAETPQKAMPVQTDNIAFAADEMVKCDGCGRINPPNRLKCFYCSRDLNAAKIKTEFIRPNLRKLEDWESGYNVICLAERMQGQPEKGKIAKLLPSEIETLKAILESRESLPLVRIESAAEAEILVKQLAAFGLECKIIADGDLADDKPPKRLRKIDFAGDEIHLTDFNTSEITRLNRNDLAVIVTGIIYRSKSETVEKIKRGDKKKVLQQTQTGSDEVLLDIYSRGDSLGYRIYTSGFDFSCLGSEKELLASENIGKLYARIIEFAPNIRQADSYRSIYAMLSTVWEIERRTDREGIVRHGFGKLEKGNTESSSNMRQFNKYSRLQWHL